MYIEVKIVYETGSNIRRLNMEADTVAEPWNWRIILIFI